MNSQHTTHVAAEAMKAAPPVTVGGLTLFGVGLADWVLLLTLVYTVLQIIILVRDKVWRHYGSKRSAARGTAQCTDDATPRQD